MIKEMLTLHALSSKLKKLGVKSVKDFLEHCADPVKSEELRKALDINVTTEQWDGAVAVVKELFR